MGFLILLFFLFLFPSNLVCQNQEKEPNESFFKQRVISKSFNETLWASLKELDQNLDKDKDLKEIKKLLYKIEPFEKYEIGKILGNLVIDELWPNQNAKMKEKLLEIIIPTCISFFVVNMAFTEKKITELNYSKLSQKLTYKIFTKLLMVRFLQKPGTWKYEIANIFAVLSAFYEYNPDQTGTLKYINPYKGCEKIILDQTENLVNKINLGQTLNIKHRKKALAKMAQVFAKPLVQRLIFLSA